MPTEPPAGPTVDVGQRIRRPPHDVFEALADPAVNTRFWYTKSSGRMAAGARLTWEWEMDGVSVPVTVTEVEADRRIRFTWGGDDTSPPTTVTFDVAPYGPDTYLRVTEAGFGGDAATQVARALDSTAGFTFLLSALKAALEHNVTLAVVEDAHPPALDP